MLTQHGKIMVFALILLTLTGSASGQTQQWRSRNQDDFELSKRFGAGLQVNILNLGIGPCAEYRITENIGLMAAVGAMFDFTSLTIRGNYLLKHPLQIAGYPARPYLGVGFTSVKADYGSSSIEQNGSGLEMYGGLLHPATYLMENLYLRGEIILSTLTLETKEKTSYGETVEMDTLKWGFLSIGWGVAYYF